MRKKEKNVSVRLVTPSESHCQKCGASDIYRRYWREGEDTQPHVAPCSRWPSTEFVNREHLYVKPAKKECIVHVCRVCGNQWDTGVMKENVTKGEIEDAR